MKKNNNGVFLLAATIALSIGVTTNAAIADDLEFNTLDKVKTQTSAYLNGEHSSIALYATKGTNTHSVLINGTTYYFTPSDETKDVLSKLTKTGAQALYEQDTPVNPVFTLESGGNTYYYSYDVSKLQSSASSIIEGTADEYNFTVSDGTNLAYKKINLEPNSLYNNLNDGLTIENGAGTRDFNVNLPNGEVKTFNYTYATPAGYTETSTRITDSAEFTEGANGYTFTNGVSAHEGGAIYISGDVSNTHKTIVSDFVENQVFWTEPLESGKYVNNAYGGAISYCDEDSANVSIDLIEGNFIRNGVTIAPGEGVDSSEVGAYGGAIQYYNDKDSKVTLGTVRGNFVGNYIHTPVGVTNAQGGAVHFGMNAKVDGVEGKFVANEIAAGSGGGGGLFARGESLDYVSADFIANRIIATSSDANGGMGGGMYTNTPIANITGDYINNYINAPGNSMGGAIYTTRSASIESITGDFIQNNVTSSDAGAYGGAIYALGTINSLEGDFIANYGDAVSNAYGGAIYSTSSIENINGDFVENYAKSEGTAAGGAIYSTGSLGDIEANFNGNHAVGENTTSTDNNAYGGAIFSTGTIQNITGDFTSNHANADTFAAGGAIFAQGAIDNISADFKGNHAIATGQSQGGAVYIGTSTGAPVSADALFNNSTFNANSVQSTDGNAMGGALFAADNNVTLANSSFEYNTAESTNSNAIGGAVFLSNSNLTLNDTTLTNNSAAAQGGAIASYNIKDDNTTVTIKAENKKVTVQNNSSALGGAIFGSKTNVVLNATGNDILLQNNNSTGTAGGTGYGIYLTGGNLELDANQNRTVTIKDDINVATAANNILINKNNEKGTVDLSGKVSASGATQIYGGTLKLSGSAFDETYNKFSIQGDSSLDLRNDNAGDVMTINTLSGDSELKLYVDYDAIDNKMDSLTVNSGAGTVTLNGINITKDNTAFVDGTETDYLTGAARNNVNVITNSITSLTDKGYLYTFTPSGDNGHLGVIRSEGYTGSLIDAIQNRIGSVVIDSYSMSDNYVLTEDLGTLAVNNRRFTIFGNGNNIDGNSYNGITVSYGQTLGIDDVGTFSGIIGSAVINEGILNVSDVIFTNNTRDIHNIYVLNLNGNNEINTITDNTPNTGITNIYSGSTQIHTSLNQDTVNIRGGRLVNDHDSVMTVNNLNAQNSELSVFDSLAIGAAVYNIGEISNTERIKGSFSNNTVTSNENSAYGAAIYNAGTLSNLRADFDNNTATGGIEANGGALYTYGNVTNLSGDFTNNRAVSGSGVAAGGAIRADYANVEINNSKFINNSATSTGTGYGLGGAIYGEGEDSNIVITASEGDVIFRGNIADNGAAIFNQNGTVTLNATGADILFENNNSTGTSTGAGTGIYSNNGINMNITKPNTITINDDIDILGTTAITGDGTLKLGSKAASANLQELDLTGNMALDLRNNNAGDNLKIDTLSGLSDAKLYVDYDATTNVMDKLTVDSGSGTITLSAVNILNDNDAFVDGSETEYLTGAARNSIIVTNYPVTSSVTSSGYIYTFTPDSSTNGLLSVVRVLYDGDLITAIQDNNLTLNAYSMSDNFTANRGFGTLGGVGRDFTIYGNGNNVYGAGNSGINVLEGQTLTIDNVNEFSNTSDYAVNNAGTLKVIDSSFTNNATADIYNIGTLTFEGDNSVVKISNEGTTNGDVTIKSGTTTIKTSADQKEIALHGGRLYNEGSINADVKGSEYYSNAINTTTNTALGASVYNEGELTLISGDFSKNTVQAEGYDAKGGAIYNTGNINAVNANFDRNSAISTTDFALGGAISSYSADMTTGITNISGDFTQNSVEAKTIAAGGAIDNQSHIASINGTFLNNSAKADDDSALGGAIYNDGEIDGIEGYFRDNNATSEAGANAMGGAIASMVDTSISNLNASFENNYAMANTGDALGGALYFIGTDADVSNAGDFGYNNAVSNSGYALGGAVYAVNTDLNFVDSSFTNNYATSTTGQSMGGAIYADNSKITITANTKDISLTGNSAATGGAIYAKDGDVVFNATGGDILLQNNNSTGTSSGSGYGLYLTGSNLELNASENHTLTVMDDINVSNPANAISINRNGEKGTVDISGKVTADGVTQIYGGTLKLSGNAFDETYNEFSIQGNSSLDLRNDNAGDVMTINTLSGDSELELYVDYDALNNSMDSLTVNSGSGKITLTAINITKDNTAFVDGTETDYLTGAARNNIDVITSPITSGTDTGYLYTFTPSGDNGHLSATRTQSDDTLIDAIQDRGAITLSSYSLTGNFVADEDFGALANDNREFTIFGNGNNIDGNSHTGITVAQGQTLNIDSIGSFANVSDVAVNNAGTLGINNSTFTGNTTDIYNTGTLILNGTNSFDTIKDDTEAKGTTNIQSGTTTILTSIDQKTINMQGGRLVNSGEVNAEIIGASGSSSHNSITTGEGDTFGGSILNIGSNIPDITGTFNNNYVSTVNGYAGGGAVANNNAGSTIENINATFTNNYAQGTEDTFGGAVLNIGTISSINGTFQNNHAQTNGNPNVSKGSAKGGAVYSSGKVETIEAVFNNNYASSSQGNAQGGAVYLQIANDDTVNVQNSSFVNNKATAENGTAQGGALYATSDTLNSLNITNTSFTGNEAADNGGAVYGNNIAITITNNDSDNILTFSGNKSNEGAAIYNNGGTLTLNATGGDILFENNNSTGTSTGAGTGIYSNNGINLNIQSDKNITINDSIAITGTTKLSGDGTLKLGSKAATTNLDVLNVSGDTSLDLRNNNAGDTLTIGELTGDNNLKLYVDYDALNNSMDKLTVNSGAGTITLTAINITRDNIHFANGTETDYLTGNARNDINVITNQISSATAGYLYVFTPDGDNGHLVATRTQTYDGDLIDAIQDRVGDITPTSYSLASNYTANENFGALAHDNREFTIFGNGNNIDGNSHTGITVAQGQTLNVDSIGSFTNVSDVAIKNAGTVNVSNSSITNNTVDIHNTGVLNLDDTNTILIVTDEGTPIGTTNLNTGTTTVNSITQNNVNIANNAKLAVTDSITANSGVVNNSTGGLELRNATLFSNVTGAGTVATTGISTIDENALVQQNVSVTSGTLNASANSLLGANVDNEGILNLSGGTIVSSISGTGDININADTTNSAVHATTGTVRLADATEMKFISGTGDTFGTANGFVLGAGSTLNLQDGTNALTEYDFNNAIVSTGSNVNIKMDWLDQVQSNSANIDGMFKITDIDMTNAAIVAAGDNTLEYKFTDTISDKVVQNVSSTAHLTNVTDNTNNYVQYEVRTNAGVDEGWLTSKRISLAKAVDETDAGDTSIYAMTGDETAAGNTLEGILTVQGNGNTINQRGVVVGNALNGNASLTIEDADIEVEGTALTVNGGSRAVLKTTNRSLQLLSTNSENSIRLNADGDNYAEVEIDAGDNTVTIANDVASDNVNNAVTYSSGVTLASANSTNLTQNVNATLIRTADTQDTSVKYNVNNGGALGFMTDSTLYNPDVNTTRATMNSINFNGGDVSTANGVVTTFRVADLQLNATSNYYGDVDLANRTMDRFVVANDDGTDGTSTVTAGTLNVAGLNLISDATSKVTKIHFADDNLKNNVEYTGPQGLTALSPIYKYDVNYDSNDGDFTFGRSGEDYSGYNPSIYAASVAAQAGGYLTQLNSYDEAFRNMDRYMLMTKSQRLSLKAQNHIQQMEKSRAIYAQSGSGYDPYQNVSSSITGRNYKSYDSSEDKELYEGALDRDDRGNVWARPYTNYEKIKMDDGPKVENMAYGTFFGGESSIHELGGGWDAAWGVYGGYNGSHQNYDGVSMYQNGGTAGVVGMAYKDNFYTGLTANVGANGVRANTMYGHEDFGMLMTGVASKTGYNIELADGKFVVQPNYLMSYSFVNTFDYKNAAGVKIDAEPLHAIQIQPGVKFIGNFENGFQPYADVAMVWNILDDSKFKANDVSLPSISVKPFVKYGVGIRKVGSDNFTGYLQTYATNGGRNGIGVQGGLSFMIGAKGNSIMRDRQSNLAPRTLKIAMNEFDPNYNEYIK